MLTNVLRLIFNNLDSGAGREDHRASSRLYAEEWPYINGWIDHEGRAVPRPGDSRRHYQLSMPLGPILRILVGD